MSGGAEILGVQLSVGEDADAHDLAEATSRLRSELLELDVEAVEAAPGGEPPPGVRAIDLAALGTLIVTLAKSELLSAVVSVVRSWLRGQHERSVKLEIDGDVLELTGVSSEEQRRLSDEWLRRHVRGQRSAQPVGTAQTDQTRSALIIANYEYQDAGLRRLRAPAHDAEALAGILRDPKIGGFDVHTMLNEPAHVINEVVEEFFAERKPDDLLLLHFSCHGLKDEGGELYFAAANTKLRRLGATAVAADFVNRRMNRSRSQRVVLLLDCCYAGAFERGMRARAGAGVGIEEHFGGRGRAVITASSAMEYAFEGDHLADTHELMPSVFTSALVEGLKTGDADRDQDGFVALDELYDYVYDRVREVTPNQTPGKWTFAVQGDLYIARRSRPVTIPAPLPPELQHAIDHPLTQMRAGAVQELERLLESRHAGLALAAKLSLEQLADDDSRMVSAAAMAALGAPPQAEPQKAAPQEAGPQEAGPPRLEVSATVLDFGRLPFQGRSPTRRVRFDNAGGGVLNPRAQAAASWLVLDQAGDELRVVVDTTKAGDHDGDVTVESNGGSATIRVLAQVGPEPPTAQAQAPAAVVETPSPEAAASPPTAAAITRDTVRPPAGPVAARSELVEQRRATRRPPAPDVAARAVARDEHRVVVAGRLAIAGAVLLAASLFPTYARNFASPDLLSVKEVMWYTAILAALAFAAGIGMLLPRRWPSAPTLLLGVAAAATFGLLSTLKDLMLPSSVLGAGFWVNLAGYGVLFMATLAVALVCAQSGDGRIPSHRPADRLSWAVALLGVAGAAALFYHAFQLDFRDQAPTAFRIPALGACLMAFVVPAYASVTMPRRFGASLLRAWAASGVAILVYFILRVVETGEPGYVAFDTTPALASISAFGLTLVALAFLAAPMGRASAGPRIDSPAADS